MRRISPPVKVSVRRNGFRVRTISRLKFDAGPEIAGWVNYRNKVYPVFKDPGGAFYLDDDGWASTRHYPLIRGEDDFKSSEPSSFRF